MRRRKAQKKKKDRVARGSAGAIPARAPVQRPEPAAAPSESGDADSDDDSEE